MVKKLAKHVNQFIKKRLSKGETEFLPAVLEVIETPPSPVGRAVMWTIIALIVGGLLWSILGHVDEVAVAPGKIIPAGFVKVIQAEDKGVVKTIHVKDGQLVKKGQLLIELDPTFSEADLARMKKEAAYYTLEIDRLMAEQAERPFVPNQALGLDEKDVAFQVMLYRSRLNEYQTRLATAQANISQNQASIDIALANQVKLAGQLEIAQERETKIAKLVEENAIAHFVLLEYRSRRLEIEQNLIGQISEMKRLEAALAQSRESLATIMAERNRDITAKIVEDRRQLGAVLEELKKAAEKERLSKIIAPVEGRVTQMAVHTLGGVVTEAQPLMVIVPEDAKLEVEAWVANKDIGFITPGQQAEVKVETFSFQKYGTIDATVTEISADAVEDKEKGRVYRVGLNLAKNQMLVGDKQVYLAPGMTATAEVKIRQKRIIEFFLDPFRQYQSEALRER